MTLEELAAAVELVDEILAATPAQTKIHRTAKKLRTMLEPGPDMEEILSMIPANNLRARAKLLGVSRQAYYGLLGGRVPRSSTVTRLAEVTGVPESVIRSATAHALTLVPE
jgi:hypothetical protein